MLVMLQVEQHKAATGEAELPKGGYPDMGTGRYSDLLRCVYVCSAHGGPASCVQLNERISQHLASSSELYDVTTAWPSHLSLSFSWRPASLPSARTACSYGEWFEFACAQRAHYNYLEAFGPVSVFLLTGGLAYPKLASAAGACLNNAATTTAAMAV